jgi:hypothetical protein
LFVNDPPKQDSRGVAGLDPLEVVMQYHQETKLAQRLILR